MVWAFQWDMSGMDVHANTTIGKYTSTFVKTITTIGSTLEGHHTKRSKSGPGSATPKTQAARSSRRGAGTPRAHHRRAMSFSHAEHSPVRGQTLALEEDLAKQTSKISRMK